MNAQQLSDPDQYFMQARSAARMEDQRALNSGSKSADELQRENSLLPEDFWKDAEVDWQTLAYGKSVQS
jgi:hypothetical protein